jgi:hypothetical protein
MTFSRVAKPYNTELNPIMTLAKQKPLQSHDLCARCVDVTYVAFLRPPFLMEKRSNYCSYILFI